MRRGFGGIPRGGHRRGLSDETAISLQRQAASAHGARPPAGADNPAVLAETNRYSPYRLGFAVKVLGGGGMASADTRRWQSSPLIERSIELLHEVFAYLDSIDVRVYRLSSQVVPYGTHPDLPQFDYRHQFERAAPRLTALAAEAARVGLRLSTHPGQYTVLNAPDETVRDKAIQDVEEHALLLDLLGQGPEATIVVHVGGLYADRLAALDRWARTWELLSDRARARLGLENDEHSFGLDDVLLLHRRTGVRVVLDVHHNRLNPSPGMDLASALTAACGTWSAGVRPKIHLSSIRTMLATPETPLRGRRSGAGKRRAQPAYPRLAQHADLVSPWDLEAVVAAAPGPLDVMLEAKAKDLAVGWLRGATARTLPALAAAEERSGPSGSRS